MTIEELFEEYLERLRVCGHSFPVEIKRIEDPFKRATELIRYHDKLTPEQVQDMQAHARSIADYIISLQDEEELLERCELFEWIYK